MPIAHVPSVTEHGILSFERAAKLMHDSVALQPVQDRRDKKQVPGGLKLHQYANLYFHARNPMMFKRKDQAADLCVLRVSTEVLKLDGVVISDSNAASDYVRFLHPSQWMLLDFDDIYAMDWRHPDDQIAYYRHSARKCAEVLVPYRLPANLILGAYVMDQPASAKLAAVGFSLPIIIESVLFFQQP
jgi:ssDNA thymidine ADP-ribosyltransferase, DarT